MARQTKIYQVKFETEGFKAVARSFQSINGQIDQTLRNYKQAQKVGVQQSRDDRGRFVRSRLGLNVERDDRFIQRKNGDNEYRSKSKGRFAFDHAEQSGTGRSQLESSAKIQGEIIGQHVAQAIRASFRGETKAEVDGNSIQTAIKSGFEFAVTSTFSGAFQRIGEETITEPVLSAMRQAFAENRKIDQSQNKTSGGVNPAKQVGRGVNFAASSVAFGAFQQVGSRFSADFVSGFIKGFDKKADQEFGFSLERRGEIFGGTVVDFAKNIGKDVDEAAADLKRSGNDLSKTVKATAKVAMQPFDTALRSYRNNTLDTVAVQRARERAAQQKPTDLSGKEEAVFVVGGFSGKQGKAGVGIARSISQNVDREKTAVIPVSNEFSDVNADAAKNPERWAAEIAAKVAALTTQGFNEDAVNMAAQAAAVKRDNPEIKIRLVGHSAGGFVAEEAQQILKMLGVESESIAIGTPNTLGGLRTGQKKHIGVGDPFAQINQALEQVGLANPFEPLQTVQGHSFPDYNVPEVADLISKNKKTAKRKPQTQAQPNVEPPVNFRGIVDRQFQQVEELQSLVKGVFQPGQTGQTEQTGLWDPDRPIPPGIVPDAVPTSARSLMAAAQARAQQMRPSQLAANQQGQIRPTRGEELPQLIRAYQKSIVVAFEKSREEMLRSLRDTISSMAQAPVEDDQAGFAENVKTSMTEQARKLLRVYEQALGAIVGVSADPSTIDSGNFGTELEQVKEDVSAILSKFQEGIVQNFQETAALMGSIAQTYQGEAPAQVAGSSRKLYSEDFNEIIQDQLTEYQRNIRKLFAEVLQNSAADFTDLRRLRAQLGLPAQAQKGGLSTRYNDRVQQLMSGARAGAQQRIRGMIPGFQEMDPKQRAVELKKMRSNLTQGLTEFRSTMGKGDQDAARKLGEGLLQRIEAIRVAYEDLGKNFTGDKRGLGAQKGQLTKQSKEIQTALEGIAKNATGSLADAIEADLGSVEGAGKAIGDSLIGGAEDSLEIRSPSKAFQRIGEQVGEGFEIGAVKALKEARAAIQKEIKYLIAVQQGDMEKAFAMVGKQAQAKGYNVGPVYHGTNANFNKFDSSKFGSRYGVASKGFFFTDDRALADYISFPDDSTREQRFNKDFKESARKRTIPAYLKTKNTLTGGKLSQLAGYRGGQNRPSNIYDENAELIDGLYDLYDSVSIQRSGSTLHTVLNPNQIKSAKPVTKTDRGKTVPLGARFDDSTDDIRGNVDNLSSFISEELDQFFADFAKQIRADLSQAGSDSIEGLTQGLKGGLADLETIAAALGITLIEGTEDTLEIDSPSKVFQRIGANIAKGLGIGLRENLEEVKQDLTDKLSELDEEAGFQATRAANKFEDMGGFPGLDAQAAEGIEMVRERLSGLMDEFPALGKLMAIGTQFGGQIALVVASFAAIGAVLKTTGIDKFIGALATLPDTAAEAGRELESLGIAFQSVTGSSGLAADAMAYVSETAEKFGINIKGAEEAYLGLVATTKGTELEGFQTQKIFEAFSQTAALRGLDQQQQQQMFTAVQQVLGKGKLSAEEVRGQLGEIPALAFQQTLAGSLGVNLQQLDKLLSTGKLQSDALFKVAQAYESANAQMSGASDTATAALSRFDNAIVKLQRSVGAEFLAVQTKGAKIFTSALNGITKAIPAIVRTINSGLILVLGSFVIQIFKSATALKLLQSALVALANLIGRLLPLLAKLAIAITAMNLAWEGAVAVFGMYLPGLTEAEKSIRKLSLEYQELSGSIDSASEAQKELGNTDLGSWLKNAAGWVFNLKERFLDAGDLGRAALFKGFQEIDRTANANNDWTARFATSAREEFAYADLTRAKGAVAEQIYVGTESKAETDEALVSAEKMLKLQQQMAEARTIAAGLNAADAEGLERTTNILKELRVEYNKYLEQVGDAQRRNRETIKANKQLVDQLVKIRLNPNLDDYAREQIDTEIDRLIGQSEALGEGQKELDAVVSRFEVTLADFTTALKRGVERLANFREKLTNTINEERAKLLETGLGLGKGEQTIRLELDRADFRELEQWVRSLRIESQKITERLQDPILADQERNLREQADREGVGFGTGFLQRIVEENTENTEAAQQLLELQNLQNQIAEGEVQLQQQALQARQSVRDLTRSVQDFLRQLEQELAEITLQLQEQVLGLQQQLRRSQLQKTIVAGSTGLFGSITSSVQGFLDAAGEIAQKYLGQERRKLEFEQKKYDLSTRLRDFSEGLNGATEALAAFKNGLTGTAAGTPAAAGRTGLSSGASAQGGTTAQRVNGPGRIPRGGYVGSAERVMQDAAGAAAMVQVANRLKIPVDQLAALMSWESAGTLNPNVLGGDGGLYKGLIQFSPDNQRRYGTSGQQSIAQQMPAIERYLIDRGFVPGQMDIRHAYSAILAGNASERYWNAADSNGTTVRNAASKFQSGDHYDRGLQFLRDSGAFAAQGGTVSPSAAPPNEVAQAQSLASEILAIQRSQIAASEGDISIAVIDLITQGENTLEEINRTLKINTRDTGVNVTALDNEVRQYGNPDALRIAETQLRQQFSDLNIRLDTQKTAIEDGIRELQNRVDGYPAIIESFRSTGDPLDQVQADLLQNVLDDSKVPMEAAKAFLKQVEEIQGRVSEAYEKENEYQTQKIRIESENSRIAAELGIAQTNRNAALELELGLQQARNNLISQIAEKEREFADRPEELKQELELLQQQYAQQKQTLQLSYDRSLLDEVAFQTEIQTRLTEAQAAQAEGQFGDNGVFGFRATALREENALLQEQIRYEQEVLAIRERYRDPAQSGLLAQTLEQARQLNQVNLQNIDTQFKDLGETIAQVAEDALGQFFEDIFTGSKTAGEALRSLAQSVLRMFAQMAAKNLAKSIFGSLGGAFGGFFGGGGGAASTATGFWGWADGGTIPNYAQGGRVLPDAVAEVMRSLVPGVDAGFRREGTKAALGIFTPGEEILSLRTGEAQRYQLLKKSLGSNPLQSIMSGSFAYGGTVGINPDILTGDMGIRAPLVPVSSVLQMNSGRGSSGGGGNVTINYEVKTPDANSFRRSQYQIDKDATVAAKRVLNRK